jgi:hypothetical protein
MDTNHVGYTYFSEDALAGRSNDIATNSNDKIREWEANHLSGNRIIRLSCVALEVGGIGNKSAAAGKSEKEEFADQPALR